MLAFIRTLMSGEDVLSAAEFRIRYRSGDAVLDVRTPAEYSAGHLEGADNVDVMAPDFAARVDALERSKTYYLYCRSGNRSGQAARRMKEMGFDNVYNIGGFEALAMEGIPVVSNAYALV